MSKKPNTDGPTDIPDPPPQPPADSPDQDLRKLQQERDDLFERLARATADFKNIQRRLQTETEQAIQFANGALIKSLLPVIDNFERALAVDAAQADPASIKKGMQIVHDQWMRVLESQDVKLITPEPGEAFDPARHEAIMHEPAAPDAKAGQGLKVTRLLQRGYMLHGRTLRPAQVAVGS